MEQPGSKKRRCPRKPSQIDNKTSTTKPTKAESSGRSVNTVGHSEVAEALAAGFSPHEHQSVTGIDTGNGDVTTNDGLDYLFEDKEEGHEPGDVVQDSHQEQMGDRLLEYNTRDLTQTQDNEAELIPTMDVSSHPTASVTPGRQGDINLPIPTLGFSPPGLTTGSTTTYHPATDLAARSATSPATPHSASRSTNVLESFCTPPSLKLPNPPQLSASSPSNLAEDETPTKVKDSDSNTNGLFFPEFVVPLTPEVRPTIARPTLGSPFAPATAPARQATAALMDVFGSPIPFEQKQQGNSAMSRSSPTLQRQDDFSGESQPNIVDPRFRTASFGFMPASNAAMSMHMNRNGIPNFVPSMAQQSPAKRMRANAGGVVPSMGHQHIIENQTYMQHQQRSVTVHPQMMSDPRSTLAQNTVPGYFTGMSPQTMTTRGNNYNFGIPLPSGMVGGIKQEHVDLTSGQKRSASQMMQQGGGGQQPMENHGITPTGDISSEFLRSQPQTSDNALIQQQAQMIHQLQMQVAMQAGSASQFGSSMPAQMHGQLQHPQQYQMAMQNRTPNRAMQNFSSPQTQSTQQRQPQPGTPHNPIATPTQMVGSSPSTASTMVTGTPTPAPRRRTTISKSSQNSTSSSSLVASGKVKKAQTTPLKRRAPDPTSSANTPQSRASINNGQTVTPSPMPRHMQSSSVSNAQITGMSGNTREQFQMFTQTPQGPATTQAPNPLQAHLPTPQQPVSTGPCPNTIHETLEETYHRSEARVHNSGLNVTPINFTSNTSDDVFGTYNAFQANHNNGMGFMMPGFGNPDMDFTHLMGSDMNFDLGLNMNTTINHNVETSPDMQTEKSSVEPPESGMLHIDPATFSARDSTVESDARTTPAGYAETLMSETVGNTSTPVIGGAEAPNGSVNMNPAGPEFSLTNAAPAVTTSAASGAQADATAATSFMMASGPSASDGTMELNDVLAFPPNHQADLDFLAQFEVFAEHDLNENADFDPRMWGFGDN